jgi:hypothetical protein
MPAAFLCLALVATMVVVAVPVPAAAASAASASVAAEPLPGEGLPRDELAAPAVARERGERVEVSSARTENSQTFATPRGTFVMEEHLQPQWVQAADGAWVDVDPTLRSTAGGGWEPAAVPVAMRFSGGGAAEPLASMSTDGVSIGLRWPGALPEPVVEGNVATYPNVAPFVDLQVVAEVDGFTHLVVIRSPKALDNLELGEIALETDLSGVSLQTVAETGAVEAVDEAGRVVFTGPSPMMWDSRDTAAGADPEQAGDKDADRAVPDDPEAAMVDVQPAMAPVSVEVSPGRLTLKPDQAMLSDPQTVYPVYVDPTWIKVTGKRNKWSLLRKSFPSSSFYNPAVGSTSSTDATKGIVRAGYAVEDRAYTDRSIFNMSTSAVKYKRINKATFSLTQSWSYYNCGSGSPPVTELWKVGGFGSSTTWNNQPSWGQCARHLQQDPQARVQLWPAAGGVQRHRSGAQRRLVGLVVGEPGATGALGVDG